MSVFGVIPVTTYISVFSPNAGEIRTRITPNTDTYHAVLYTPVLNQTSFCHSLKCLKVLSEKCYAIGIVDDSFENWEDEKNCWKTVTMRYKMAVQVFYPKIKSKQYSPLSGLRSFLAADSPLKIMKNDFYFVLKKFISFSWYSHSYLYWFFGHVGTLLVKKAKFNFKSYVITGWTANNYNTHIAQYVKK